MEEDIFIEEALELLEEMEESLLQLQEEPKDEDTINRLFRAVHTVKGSGAMFGFTEVADFAHKYENAIDAVRKGEAALTDDCINLFLKARDHIATILDAEEPTAQKIQEISGSLIKELVAAVETGGAASAEAEQKAPAPQSAKPPQTSSGPAAGQAQTLQPNRNRQETPPPTGNFSEAAAKLGLRELKTLIVEDEFTSRFIIQEFLFPLGTCHVAVNGFEAILAFKTALTEKKPYDLICLDIMMPGMDGIDVAKEMRRLEGVLGREKPSKIIMTTAVSDQKIILEMFEQKLCDAYLLKPIQQEKLYEVAQGFFKTEGK